MQNQLRHLKEFRHVLSNYHISDHGKAELKNTNLVLLVAPTSSGRNTIIKELVKTGHYYFIISDTTRIPRVNNGVLEQNGHEYWFKSEEEVLQDLKAGEFLEAAIIHDQQVSGISLRELKKAQLNGKIAITDIEVIGGDNIHKIKPDTTILFILPPSLEEWIRRLKARSDMTLEEFNRRINSATKELKAAISLDYYQFVINDQFDETIKYIQQIVTTGKINEKFHQAGLKLAKDLYAKLKATYKVL